MSARRKLAVLAALVAGSWLLVIMALHNPSLALLVGSSLVIKPTAERQAELDRPEVNR